MIDITTIAIDTGIYNVNASNKAIIVLCSPYYYFSVSCIYVVPYVLAL